MLKQILWNEVTDALGRQPTNDEFTIFVDFINDCLIDEERGGKLNKVFLSNVELFIQQCLKDNFVKCEECGEYFLPNSDEWNETYHCCRECKPYHDILDDLAPYIRN